MKWIMVTESVPEKDGFYLVTVDGSICGQNEPIITISELKNGKWLDPVIACLPSSRSIIQRLLVSSMTIPGPYKG